MISKLVVMHVTEGHSKAEGGVTSVVNDLTRNINILGGESIIVAASDDIEFTHDGIKYFPLGLKTRSVRALFSQQLKEKIRRIVIDNNVNVIHLHGFWLPLQLITARIANEMNIPFVLTVHGMLEPWLWRGKGLIGLLKKKAYFHFFAYPAFRNANVVHAITPMEAENLKKLFPNNECVIIPNALDLTERSHVENRLEKVIFFIGRINPKKGVHLLLEAFKMADLPKEWRVVIAGPEEVPDYVENLHDFIIENKLTERVSFAGSVYAEEKAVLYRSSWITVVPSYSEVVGMVNLEAASEYCPTITTYNTGLWDWEEGGGVLFEPKVKDLVSALKKVTEWDESQRRKRGQASYNLVKEYYEWGVVGKQWIENYNRIKGINS